MEMNQEELKKLLYKEIVLKKDVLQEVKEKILLTLKDFNGLKTELLSIKDSFNLNKKLLKERLDILVKTGAIKEETLNLDKYNKSIEEYEKFLDLVSENIEKDIKEYQDILAGTGPEKIEVLKWAPEDSDLYLILKIKESKKQLKDTQKNLRISSSRHKLNFESQIREFEYLISYIYKKAKEQEKK